MDDVSDTRTATTNREIRQWYLEQVSHIPELNRGWLQQGLSAREWAEMAWCIRHDARLYARSMMADRTEVELLRQRDVKEHGNPDGPTFEFLVEKMRKTGLEEDAINEAIIEGTYRTNTGINKMLGL